MAGRQNEAKEQLVPKGDGGMQSSSSASHAFPAYSLPLPGTFGAGGETGNGVQDGRGQWYPMAAAAQSAPAPAATARGEEVVPPGTSRSTEASSEGLPPPTSRPAPAGSGGGSSVMAAMEIQEALLPTQAAASFVHPISLGRRRWMVFMFCVVAALLFADQNLLAPNLTEAAEYFGMSERQKDTLLGGALMAAFFAVGAPAALLVGWLADRGDINRRSLLFWVVVVGEMPCLLTYWVTSFWQFFLLRALTGIAVGGCFPLVFSLLGDLFPPTKRAAVSAVVQIATGVGLAVGQALAGSIGPATNWRVPFVVVAAPSLAVALIMRLTTTEPPRGAFEAALQERYAEGAAYEGSISWAKVAVLLRCPSNALIIAQGLPGSLPWGMVLTYFNDFLSQQKGFTVQAATLVLLMFGAGGAVGVIAGGAGGQWLYNRRKEYQALLSGGCVLLGIAPLYVLINADLVGLGLGPTCIISALGGAVASVAGPNLRCVMLNVNEPETRGVALALQSMTDDLGKGLGPVLVAGLIHTMGRQGAFNVAAAGWVPCGALLASLACCMRRDEAAMQARLAKSAEAQAAAADQTETRADGDRSGISIPPTPGSPPPRSSHGGAANGSETAASLGLALGVGISRNEERRVAKVRLLDAMPTAGGWGPDAAAAASTPAVGGAYQPLADGGRNRTGGSAEYSAGTSGSAVLEHHGSDQLSGMRRPAPSQQAHAAYCPPDASASPGMLASGLIDDGKGSHAYYRLAPEPAPHPPQLPVSSVATEPGIDQRYPGSAPSQRWEGPAGAGARGTAAALVPRTQAPRLPFLRPDGLIPAPLPSDPLVDGGGFGPDL